MTERRTGVVSVTVALAVLLGGCGYRLAGTGGGSFYAVYPLYASQSFENVSFDRTHNDYLQFAAEYGVPVTLLLGLAVLISLWLAIRTQLRRRDRLLQGMAFASAMGIVALLIRSATDFNLQIPANAAFFMVLLALAWVCRYWDPLESPQSGNLS